MIKHIDFISTEDQIPLIDNVLKASSFVGNSSFCNSLLTCWAVYFNEKTQTKWVWENDGKVEAICMCIIGNATSDIHYDLSQLEPQSEKEKQYITFRKRITEKYKEISFNCEAELEIMSSLNKHQGIGKQLLAKLEEELLNRGITRYTVSTNQMCDYMWYLNQGFKIYQTADIDISDLNYIFNETKTFKLFTLIKDIQQ